MGKFTDLASGLNLKLKETNIESEKFANIKAPGHLKSCLKSEAKTKVPVSIQIPIRHKTSPIRTLKTANIPVNAECQYHSQSAGPNASDGFGGEVHSVSTQTDKDGCSVM
eukprot:GFUD01048425.1.p1 GENE.GFUD01048425.1~~GFUD01048425.1.p1  ORF type:complete len:129 (+),score=32.91 GFUD01048425.1:59-388(+)